MSGPAVGVVIPTRDRPELLKRAIRSVLLQRDASVRIVVVDDSADGSALSTVDGIAFPGLIYVRSGFRNVGQARNLGASLVKDLPFLSFLDDDDFWMPSRLGSMLEAVTASGCQWAVSGEIKLNANLSLRAVNAPVAARDLCARLRSSNSVPGSASGVLVASSAFWSVGGFDAGFRRLEDWDLWLRLAELYPATVVDQPLVLRVSHRSGSSRDLFPMIRGLVKFRTKHGRAPGEPSAIAASLPQLGRALAQQDRRVLAASALAVASTVRRDRSLGRSAWQVLCDPAAYLERYDDLRLGRVSDDRQRHARAELASLLGLLETGHWEVSVA